MANGLTVQEAGRRGGLAAAGAGGKARAAKMTAEERKEAARKAAKARWAKVSADERSAFAKKIRKGGKKGKARKKGG